MKVLIKSAFAAAALLLLLAGIAAAVLWYQGDRVLESLRPAIQSQLSTLAGGDVSFSSLRARLIPSIQLVVEDLTLIPARNCIEINIDSVQLHLAPQALLEQRLVIDSIRLVKPRVALSRSKGPMGSFPLSSGCHTTAVSSVNAPGQEDKSQRYASASRSSLRLKKLEIDGAEIDFVLASRTHAVFIERLAASADFNGDRMILTSLVMDARLDKTKLLIDGASFEAAFKNERYRFEKFSATINNQKILASGSVDAPASSADLQIETPGVSLASLSELSSILGVNYGVQARGTVSCRLALRVARMPDWSMSGTAAVRQLEIPRANLALAGLALDNLSIESKGELLQSAFEPALSGFSLRDGQDAYTLSDLSGVLQLQKNKNSPFLLTGKLDVNGFGFSDAETKLERASAELSGISAALSPQHNLLVSFNTRGHSVILSHPQISITDMRSLSAPLRIEIPAKGGYSVSGPVSVEGVALRTGDREFSEVAGKVDMLVSGPLKRFSSQSLKAVYANLKLAVTTDFSMRPDSYSWEKTSLRADKGVLTAALKLQRNAARAYQAELSAREFQLSSLIPLLKANRQDDFSGRLQSFKASLRGNFPDAMESMAGEGEFSLIDPLLKNYNLTRALSTAISRIPLMGTALVPASDTEDSAGAAAEGKFTVKNSLVSFPRLIARRSRYTAFVKGEAGFDSSLNARADVVFLADTFRSLGLGFDTFGSLLSRTGKISIPVNITGNITEPEVTVDLQRLATDNSGLPLIGSAISTTAKVGSAVGKAVLSPLRVLSSRTPTPSAQAESKNKAATESVVAPASTAMNDSRSQ